jgi:hypothetical protein
MLLSSVLVLLGHCVASSLASPYITDSFFDGIAVGKPFNLTWTNAVGPVTLNLVRDLFRSLIVAPIASMFDRLSKYFFYYRALLVPIS